MFVFQLYEKVVFGGGSSVCEIPHYLTRLSTKQNNFYCLSKIASSRKFMKEFSFSRHRGLDMHKDTLHKFDLYGLFGKKSQTF